MLDGTLKMLPRRLAAHTQRIYQSYRRLAPRDVTKARQDHMLIAVQVFYAVY